MRGEISLLVRLVAGEVKLLQDRLGELTTAALPSLKEIHTAHPPFTLVPNTDTHPT